MSRFPDHYNNRYDQPHAATAFAYYVRGFEIYERECISPDMGRNSQFQPNPNTSDCGSDNLVDVLTNHVRRQVEREVDAIGATLNTARQLHIDNVTNDRLALIDASLVRLRAGKPRVTIDRSIKLHARVIQACLSHLSVYKDGAEYVNADYVCVADHLNDGPTERDLDFHKLEDFNIRNADRKHFVPNFQKLLRQLQAHNPELMPVLFKSVEADSLKLRALMDLRKAAMNDVRFDRLRGSHLADALHEAVWLPTAINGRLAVYDAIVKSAA